MPFSLDKLFIEWRQIVPNGIPNPKNDYHLVLLKEICFGKGIDKDIIDSVILALEQEETFTAKKKDTGNVVAFKSKKSRDDAIEGGDYEEVDKKDDEKKKEKPTTKLGGDELSTDTYAKSLTSDEDNDIDDSDTETQSQENEKVKAGEPNQKDKSLDQEKITSQDEVFSNPDTGIDDEKFKNQDTIKSNFDSESEELKVEQIEKFFESGKIPKKYATVITRLVNSEKTSKVSITDFLTGVGAGELQAQAGEVVTMAGIGMDDDEFEEFANILNEKMDNYPKGSKPILTKEWLQSAKAVRSITKKRYDKEFGEGNWKISNTAWDVKNEFEALGNDDYEKNKGFSTDMYVKVEANGEQILDEISLKKDSDANIFNGVVTDIENWFDPEPVPDKASFKKYRQGENERPAEYGKNGKTLNYDVDAITDSELYQNNKNLAITLRATGVIRKVKGSKNNWEINPGNQKLLEQLAGMEIPPPIDLKRFKEVTGTGAMDRYKKAMIIHAAINGVNGDEESLKFLNNHIGYEKDDDGKFPEGSIKRYQNDTITTLVESEKAKKALLDALSEKLPLKSLIEGEEKIAIGGLSGDKATLKEVFGIDNYEDFQAGLTMEEDEDGNNYLVYASKEPAKVVKISEVKVRQKGQGYASSVGLEFAIADDFAKQLYDANKELYPPEPDITDKERRKLKV